jgi:hypothetical protein
MSRTHEAGWSGGGITPCSSRVHMKKTAEHSTSHTKSVHAVHHTAHHAASAAPEATTATTTSTEIAATAGASGTPATPATVPKSLGTIVAQAIAQIDALEANLGLDIVVPPNDKDQNRALNRVSDTALGLASDIVSSAPERFPDFSGIAAGAAYAETMQPLAARIATLGTHVQNSIQNQRGPAAQQTLALYTVVKGLGRIVSNETMREKVPQLKVEIAPKHKVPKPKQTKSEKAVKVAAKNKGKRINKALATLAAEGVTIPAVNPPTTVTSGTPAPQIAPAVAAGAAGVATTAANPVDAPAQLAPVVLNGSATGATSGH